MSWVDATPADRAAAPARSGSVQARFPASEIPTPATSRRSGEWGRTMIRPTMRTGAMILMALMPHTAAGQTWSADLTLAPAGEFTHVDGLKASIPDLRRLELLQARQERSNQPLLIVELAPQALHLVEQHRRQLVVLHGLHLAGRVAHDQIGVHLLHFFRDQAVVERLR